MSSDFVCKECGWRSEVVSAAFQIEMAASYVHDGLNFRQHSLRAIGYTLNEDMDTAITVCPNCGNTGTVAESYNQIFICRNCGKDTDDKGGFCSYNAAMYCSRCYKKFKITCEGCVDKGACELRKINLSKTERIKEAAKTKDTSKSVSEMPSTELREPLNFDAVRVEEEMSSRPPRVMREHARDTSVFTSSDSSVGGWNTVQAVVADEDDSSEEEEDE